MAIVLFTDFGSRDPYVGQVKAVLLAEAPGVPVIDLLNDAPSFAVKASAHLLAALAQRFPAGAAFVCVVDPGVGGERAPAVVRADGRFFIGPDNGLLSVVAARSAGVECWHIAWRPPAASVSFHGRDVFAPVAARLAAGTLPPEHLVPVDRLEVDLGAADLAEIIYIDHYGNASTGLRAEACPEDALLCVRNERLRHARVFAEAGGGQPFWYANSAGLIEIALDRGSAAARLGLAIGDPVSILA